MESQWVNGTPSPPSSNSSAPNTPSLSSVFSPEDEDLLFSVMNSNVPVEGGNFWFPSTHDAELPSLDSILQVNNTQDNAPGPTTSRADRKKAQQSNASKRYRIKKKQTSENLSQENSYLQRELQLSQQQVHQLSQQINSLQIQLSQAQSALYAATQNQSIVPQNLSPIPQSVPVTPERSQLKDQIDLLQNDLQATLQQIKNSLNTCIQQRTNMTATFDDPTIQASSLKIHLDSAHQIILRQHNALSALAQSAITPNTQAYWAIFEPPHSVAQPVPEMVPSECVFVVADTNNIWWRDYALSAQATPQQLNQISSLQRRYCQGIARIKKERFQYSLQVREFYWQRVYRIQFRFPGSSNTDTSKSTFQVTQVELLCKLQLLKHNIDEERTLLTETYNELSYALHPLQEALLLVKLFEEAQNHLDHFHSVHDIWEKMGGENVGSPLEDKNCSLM